MLQPEFILPPPVKLAVNIGACFDVPTGQWELGVHGEALLLGGLSSITGITGIGNCFKTTIMQYMVMTAAARILKSTDTFVNTYDTEMHIHESRVRSLMEDIEDLDGRDLLAEGKWTVTDKTVYFADTWWDVMKKYLKEKRKTSAKSLVETPFIGREPGKTISLLPVTISQIDSFSEFESEDTIDMKEKNDLGDSSTNTLYMRQGLMKSKFISELPGICTGSNHFIITTAQIGDEITMGGPPGHIPDKQLQYLQAGKKIKGVSPKFFFLSNSFWFLRSRAYIHKDTKSPHYPKDKEDGQIPSADLNIVNLMQLRCKNGASGYSLELLVSQSEGVLSTLTEFYNIHQRDFGLGGNDKNYYLELMPDVSLSRTTVRKKITESKALRRAINITSEISQNYIFHRDLKDELVSPKELYEFLTSKGYDMNMILTQTRGWWTYKNDATPGLYLSSLDLCRMARGLYHPFWMTEDLKVKDEYKHLLT
jgi:hypothetical protein